MTVTASVPARTRDTFYITIWVCLLLLFLVGLAIFVLDLPRTTAATLIFGLAAIKAGLVLRHYMHLKHEHMLIYLMVLVPTLLFIGFAISLVPDIVWHHNFGGG
ncbi:MAG TPA: cytochrome C oxidase subunit IV family protein [Terriglobales bacterium]|nr:cytochrome C oxidase subunit IV family protein [Terriglobales bacterium]